MFDTAADAAHAGTGQISRRKCVTFCGNAAESSKWLTFPGSVGIQSLSYTYDNSPGQIQSDKRLGAEIGSRINRPKTGAQDLMFLAEVVDFEFSYTVDSQ